MLATKAYSKDFYDQDWLLRLPLDKSEPKKLPIFLGLYISKDEQYTEKMQ